MKHLTAIRTLYSPPSEAVYAAQEAACWRDLDPSASFLFDLYHFE